MIDWCDQRAIGDGAPIAHSSSVPMSIGLFNEVMRILGQSLARIAVRLWFVYSRTRGEQHRRLIG